MRISRFTILSFCGLLALSSCSQPETEKKPEEKKDAAATESKPVRVRTAALARGAIASLIETTSNIEAESIVDIFPKTQGIIAQLFVEEGAVVQPNQALAKIEDQELRIKASETEVAYRESLHKEKQAELGKDEADHRQRQTRNNADQAKRDYDRNKNLAAASSEGRASLISQRDLEASKLAWDKAEGEDEIARFTARKSDTDLESAKIASERAKFAWELTKLQLADTEIKARTAGVISFRGIKIGETVTLTTRAFTVVNLDQLITNFYRPQKELRYLAANIPIEASCEAFPDMMFKGTVLRVNPVVDPNSGTFKVTAQIDNPEKLLRPGMLIRTKITTSMHSEAYLISKKAIFFEGEKQVVFAVREGIAVRVPLEAGFSDAERIEVLNVSDNGLRPTDRIVVVGNAELRDGAKVEVVEG